MANKTNKNDWTTIKEFPNYQIHPQQGIRNSKTQKILKGRTWMGYPRVTLMNNGKKNEVKIHRLVAKYFVQNKDPRKLWVVNHKDGNRMNFSVNNLEWMDQSANMFDRWANKGKRKKYVPEY